MKKITLLKWVCIILAIVAVTAIASSGQTFTLLQSFDQANGAFPEAGLVQGTDGNFYGTTSAGTKNGCPGVTGDTYGCGTVFKITPTGVVTTLHTFAGSDGANPSAALVLGTDGNFYGTTEYGGGYNYGTIFQITPSGTVTTLWNFGYYEGAYPLAQLVQGADGNFYGTASAGGAFGNYGTIFRITQFGSLTLLHSFNSTDGASPESWVMQGSDGNFYGTTFLGGANTSCYSGGGCGTVFKITPTGTLTTLHSFAGYPIEGTDPIAGLVQGTDGNFYGTTYEGGANKSGAGTVFKITPSGALTTLYSFCPSSPCTDGSNTHAGLVQGSDGNFYGVTTGGGASGWGTIFKITPTGTLTTLHSFTYSDGEAPVDAPLQGTDGNFYGTASEGGAYNYWGTVFRLSAGLTAFLVTNPTSGSVGSPVVILGNNLTGASSVRFNGTSATFTVTSSSEIQTSVPAGATTGKVTVVTSSGTLQTNQNFVVSTLSTTTALTSSSNPSAYGQSVTFTATVTPGGSGTPTGNVTFYDATYSANLCIVALSGGQSVCTSSTLSQGSHNITATYGGDSNFQGSTSPVLTQVVQINTLTGLTSIPNPSNTGQSVTFTATVITVPTGLGTPTGTVIFYDGGTILGSATVNSGGVAAYITAALSTGSHNITATYGGSSTYLSSTSPVLTQVVQASTATAVVSSLNPSNVGQTVTFTATVSVTSPGTGAPTGTVTFYDGTTSLGSVTLGSNDQASYATSALAAGSHSITATYGGSAIYLSSTSPVLTQVVNALAAVTFSPTSISFGNQALNQTSASKSVTVKNSGTAMLTLSSITVTGDFAISANTCGATLAAGKTCIASVDFTPPVLGALTGALSFTDNAANSPQTVPLSGTGVQPATVTPATGAFGNQAVLTPSTAKNFILTNNQSAALTVSGITFTGTNPGDFAETDTCDGSVAAKGKCTISVTFTPQTTGKLTATLNVVDGASNSPQTVSLTGTSVAQVTWTPVSLVFPSQALGTTSAVKAVAVTNNLSTALSISGITFTGADPADFAETDTCDGTVVAKGKCTISVRFMPQAAGSRKATLNVADSANNSPQTVSLTGTGVAQVTWTPTALVFASQAVGTTSAAKVVTVTNNLPTDLTLSGITFTGADPGDFAETDTCDGTVASKGKCTISVTFTPQATGSRTATLNINDSANTSPQTVSLTGTGK